MEEALRSLLCEGGWSPAFVRYNAFHISFSQDGTGKYSSMGDNTAPIMCYGKLSWKMFIPTQESPIEPIGKHKTPMFWVEKPVIVGTFRLEITLSTELPESSPKLFQARNPNIGRFKEAAFLPRLFTVTIEEGNFTSEVWDHDLTRTGLRMTFDQSPFPVQENWERPPPGSDRRAQRDHPSVYPVKVIDEWARWASEQTVFQARYLPKSALRTRAMNDDRIFGYKTGGCVVS
ncbi:hypothetical protein AMS68_006125 [Peltaster fructicola]|uniref:Uncharacterized protein n=1 Tax=Peltaster fructicola TaxID=286661 RepID=A0A6H0Y184_9PEZI|nr:hypothetical protein AMS68_006125 [Peltaster fructicola]